MILPPSPSTHERRWVLGFAAVMLLVTALPYLLGFASQGEMLRFTGFVFGVEDGNSYIAKMQSGSAGAWLFRSPYTAFPQEGLLMFLPYLLLGKLAAPAGMHEQLAALFHLFRLFGGAMMIVASYDFLALFLTNVTMRRLGLALVIFGGGMGWLLVLAGQGGWLGSLPLDLYSPETFGFLSLYGLPHLALGRAMLLWSLVLYLRAVAGDAHEPERKRAILGASLWFAAGIAQPLAALLVGVVVVTHLSCTGIWQLVCKKRGLQTDWRPWQRGARWLILCGWLPGLLVLYNAFVAITDPFMRLWTQQNIIRSPHPFHYFAAYGLLLPFVLAGGISLVRRAPWSGWLPVGWVIILPVLAYAPVDLQRRLPEGLWVAWVALALVALENWLGHQFFRPFWQKIIVALPVIFCFLTPLLLLAGGIQAASSRSEWVFRPASETRLFERLAEHSKPGSVVLSAYQTGNALPAWAPVRVVIGHGPETLHRYDLQREVEAFYTQATPDAQRQALIDRFDVRYVWWGPHERLLGSWNPAQADYLRLVGEEGDYMLFEVVR